MGGRYRARAHAIQVIEVKEVPSANCKRATTTQFHVPFEPSIPLLAPLFTRSFSDPHTPLLFAHSCSSPSSICSFWSFFVLREQFIDLIPLTLTYMEMLSSICSRI